ncbi:MAG TPA: hypothetical protein VL501_10080 [Pyrinomonadaceae bacterium]|nr:hypothetical protein [Pyrinomonadaceae bacterium]
MKKLILAIAVIFVSSLACVAQAPCKALFAPAGGAFTLCPPDSLHSVKPPEVAGAPFAVLVTDTDPVKNSLAFIIIQVKTPESLRESVYGLIEGAFAENRQAVVKELANFKTTSGTEGIRLLYENTVLTGIHAGERSTKIYYVFPGPGVQVVFSAAMSAKDAAGVATSDAMIKTVVIKPGPPTPR